MKKLAKILSIVLVLATVAVCGFAFVGCDNNNDENTIQVYTSAGFAPYEYLDANGNVVGVDIDIMNAIGKELGYKVVINDVEFKTIPDYIQKSTMAIGAAGMSKTDARDKVMAASITYATSIQYVILPASNKVAKTEDGKVSLESLAGMKIGTQAGTTGYYLVSDADKDNCIEYKNAIVASGDIGSSVDAVVIDSLPAKSIVEGNSNLVCYELTEAPESYCLYLNQEATELLAKINVALQKLIDNGSIDQYTINHSSGK